MVPHLRHVHGHNLHFAIRLTKKSCDGGVTRALGIFGPARAQRTTVLIVNKAYHCQREDKVQLEGYPTKYSLRRSTEMLSPPEGQRGD